MKGRDTRGDMAKLAIRSYALAAAIIGLLSMLFFFPSAEGCSDLPSCALFSFCGLTMGGLGIWLFFRKHPAKIAMLGFSALFSAYFTFEVIHTLVTDQTGQGLIGLLLALPMFVVCLAGLVLLLMPRLAREFRPTTGPA